MVLQQRVYATGNPAPSTRTVNSASSRGGGEREPWVGRSQKDFLEQHILRRREAEVGLPKTIQTENKIALDQRLSKVIIFKTQKISLSLSFLQVKRLSFWSETSQYFDKVAKNAERWVASPELFLL